MSETSSIDWERLRAPFDPAEVDFRIQSKFDRGGKPSAVVVAYIDARTVQDRLDAVVGPQNWAFDWEPVAVVNGTVAAAKGTLTICGVSKSDVGDPGKTEPTKASVSDALKRAAVMWGIGRYLYGLPKLYAEIEKRDAAESITRGDLDRLRGSLPRPSGATPPTPTRQPAPQRAEKAASHPTATQRAATAQAASAPAQRATRPSSDVTDARVIDAMKNRTVITHLQALGMQTVDKQEAALAASFAALDTKRGAGRTTVTQLMTALAAKVAKRDDDLDASGEASWPDGERTA